MSATRSNATTISLAILGVVGAVGITLIFLCDEHAERALQNATSLMTFLGMVAGFIITATKVHRVQTQTNSRWEEMREVFEKVAFEKGQASEHLKQQAKKAGEKSCQGER